MTISGQCDGAKVTCVTSGAEDLNVGVKPVLSGHCCDQGLSKLESISRSYSNFISTAPKLTLTVPYGNLIFRKQI